jgi:ferritin-like metal-binding protein YciE
MSAGGKGFLLFAKLQPDTPGKLAAHALSYEALELASYELLSRVAERADASDVVDAAQQIRDQERMMMERLESSFDLSVAASLRELGTDDIQEQLRKYLADAHAIEEQAIQLLEKAPSMSEGTPLAEIYSEHLDETRDHAELVADRLKALGGDPSTLKDAALRLGGLNWGMFFQSHPDTPGKLAAFAFAFEHLEIGGYEQLRRVAERAGDTTTAGLAERIISEERTAADKIAAHFDEAAAAALASEGVA